MHGKERAIAAPLRRGAGLQVVVPDGLNTDSLGTFTGDVARAGTMEDAARAKARMGMAVSGLPLGLASEGAYGPQPQMPLLAHGLEVLIFVDDLRGIEVIERITDPRPTYAQIETYSAQGAAPLLRAIRFPHTAVTISLAPRAAPIARGVADAMRFAAAMDTVSRMSRSGIAYLQTDMRAHVNPRRMAVIRALAVRMARRLATPCPACGCPGFGRTGSEPGLPCGDCGTPTAGIRAEVHGCPACDHTETRPRVDGVTVASPAECPACNP